MNGALPSDIEIVSHTHVARSFYQKSPLCNFCRYIYCLIFHWVYLFVWNIIYLVHLTVVRFLLANNCYGIGDIMRDEP